MRETVSVDCFLRVFREGPQAAVASHWRARDGLAYLARDRTHLCAGHEEYGAIAQAEVCGWGEKMLAEVAARAS